jgi:hypothetical protein
MHTLQENLNAGSAYFLDLVACGAVSGLWFNATGGLTGIRRGLNEQIKDDANMLQHRHKIDIEIEIEIESIRCKT